MGKKDRKKALKTATTVFKRNEELINAALKTATPMIGTSVFYRTDGRNGLIYDLPAVVNCTVDTHPGDYPDGSPNPLPVPSDPMNVHLTVFTPGGFGTAIQRGTEDSPWVIPTQAPVDQTAEFKTAIKMITGSGTYVEHDVPMNTSADPTPRSWRLP